MPDQPTGFAAVCRVCVEDVFGVRGRTIAWPRIRRDGEDGAQQPRAVRAHRKRQHLLARSHRKRRDVGYPSVDRKTPDDAFGVREEDFAGGGVRRPLKNCAHTAGGRHGHRRERGRGAYPPVEPGDHDRVVRPCIRGAVGLEQGEKQWLW